MTPMHHSLLLQKIAEHGCTNPHKTAIVTADGFYVSYQELMENIRRAAEWLAARGVRPGDRVMLSAQKEVEFVYLYVGAHLRGIVNVVVDASNSKEHLEYIASAVSPALAVGMALDGIPSVNYPEISLPERITETAEAAGLTPESVADIMFTSGTTGKPKGVCLSHANIAASASNINRFIGNGEEDIEFLGLPICHSFGLGRLRCNMLTGATVVLHNGFANLKSVFAAFEKYGVTGFGMVPAVWAYIKRFSGSRIGRYAGQLRYIEIGSAAMPMEDKEILMNLFPDTRICMHYGLTEASRAVFMEFHEDKDNLSAAGRSVVPEVDVKILREDGSEACPDEDGEVCIRGNMVMKRYLLDSDNDNAFHGGYFRTGDWGHKDADGRLYLVARKKEIINVGGKKVSPVEIEDALEKIGVRESMCVADKDPILGEVPKALLVEGSFTKDIGEIKAELAKMLEPYKLPKSYDVVKSIPKTESGKKKRTI